MVSQFALPKSIRDATKRSDVQNVGGPNKRGQAEAADGAAPKQDRLPSSGQDFYPFAGPPEGVGEHWGEVGKSAATGARNVLEGTAGGTADIMQSLPQSLREAIARTMLGPTGPQMIENLPTTEDVAGWTDSWMPAGAQDYTRHESKDPGAAIAQQAVEWGFDPLEAMMPALLGARIIKKGGKFF